MPEHPGERDERIIAGVVYILFLIGPANGLTMLIGAIIGWIRMDKAPEWLRGHYVYSIRTLLYALAAAILGAVLILTIIFSLVGILLISLIAIWVLVRSAIGLIRLVDGRGHPDPKALLF